MFVFCVCCVLSGSGFCDELITSPQEFYRLWCVTVLYFEKSGRRRYWPNGGGGLSRQKQTNNVCRYWNLYVITIIIKCCNISYLKIYILHYNLCKNFSLCNYCCNTWPLRFLYTFMYDRYQWRTEGGFKPPPPPKLRRPPKIVPNST